MNQKQNPYIQKQSEHNPYKARKEKNPYIKEEIPHLPNRDDQYHKKLEENTYQRSKEEIKKFCPRKEENPYLKKNDGSLSLVEKSFIKEDLKEKVIHTDQHQKTKIPVLDVKVTMNSLQEFFFLKKKKN
jgi:hypothetical protein